MIMEKPDYCKVTNDYDKIAGLYNIGNTIGRGHYAVVKEAKHVFTEEKVAIKVIDKTKLDAQSREHLFSEVMCMKLVQHPNVVRLYEVIDTVNKLYLVLELGDAGDLYDYIMKYENGLPEIKAKRYFRQIVQAIAYCHNLHVVHRDLKPENVVFFEKLELVKLTDFGFSNKFTPGQTLQTSCGSLAYSAPEILLGDAYDAPKVDIWSLGVILFMLVCGRLPFDEANDSETLSRIMDCRYDLPNRLSGPCQSLIRTMLVRAPEQRASLEQILASEWMEREHFEGVSGDFDEIDRNGDSYVMPLIAQQQLSVEEHVDILTKMSEGNLASVEDIQVTLDRNEYSYITATYFLLAERKLKRRQYEQFCKMKLLQLEAESRLEPIVTTSVTTVTTVADAASEERIRRFSMILEDEEVEEEAEELDAMISLASVREELALTVSASRCCSRASSDSDKLVHRNNRCRSAIYPSQSRRTVAARQTRHRQSLPGGGGHASSQATSKGASGRSNPVLYHGGSASHSTSDISDTESLLLRGFSDQKRISVPKSFGRHFLSLKPPYHHTKPLTPDWMNSSCSSIESDGGPRYHPSSAIGRRLRVSGGGGSRPSSMGATVNAWSSSTWSDVDDVVQQVAATSSPTGAAVHRDICAPIHEEEDELMRSRSYIDGREDSVTDRSASSLGHSVSAVDCHRHRRRSDSVQTHTTTQPLVGRSLYRRGLIAAGSCVSAPSPSLGGGGGTHRSLSQSNFSLSSFASSLRDSKAMMNVVRGAFELQCLANRTRSGGDNCGARGGVGARPTSASVSVRQSRCEFSSVTSLPPLMHSPDDGAPELSLPSPPSPCLPCPPPPPPPPHCRASLHRHDDSATHATATTTTTNILIRASSTLTRKARFIMSCCRTS